MFIIQILDESFKKASLLGAFPLRTSKGQPMAILANYAFFPEYFVL